MPGIEPDKGFSAKESLFKQFSSTVSSSPMKNTLINILLKLIRVKKKGQTGEPRILVVSTTGLGDSLWGTPAIRALKHQHPDTPISLLTSPMGKEVFLNSPYIDQLFVLDAPFIFSAFKLFFTLRKKGFTVAYIFHISQRITLPLVYLASPSKIVGTTGINKGLDHLLTHPIPPSYTHEIERRLEIVNRRGSPPEMEMFITESEHQTALKHLPPPSLRIGIHPGAKDRFKRWNPKYFVELGKRLAEEKGATILITGDRSEGALCREIADQIPRALNLAGTLSVRLLAALIEQLDLFITNDTGPMHIAFAMNVKTLALFSPTDPNLCGPYKVSAQVVAKSPTCTPCIRKKCLFPFCMEQLSPQEVYDKISL